MLNNIFSASKTGVIFFSEHARFFFYLISQLISATLLFTAYFLVLGAVATVAKIFKKQFFTSEIPGVGSYWKSQSILDDEKNHYQQF